MLPATQVRAPLPMQDINLAASCMRMVEAHLDEFRDDAAGKEVGPRGGLGFLGSIPQIPKGKRPARMWVPGSKEVGRWVFWGKACLGPPWTRAARHLAAAQRRRTWTSSGTTRPARRWAVGSHGGRHASVFGFVGLHLEKMKAKSSKT